ncbi:MAG: peptidylprolyl isomerase [Planctomycetaceae bacterium]
MRLPTDSNRERLGVRQGMCQAICHATRALPGRPRWVTGVLFLCLARLGQLLLGQAVLGLEQWSVAQGTLSRATDRGPTLVELNGEPLVEADFQRFCRLNGIPTRRQRDDRDTLLAHWVDRQLVEQHLRQKKVTPHPDEVERAWKHVRDAADGDPEEATQRLAREFGSPEELRQEFTFRLAWRRLVETHEEGRAWRRHFEQHRDWYDGTRVRARQIFLKVPRNDAGQRASALAQLKDVRSQIERGDLDFGDAARELSQAPSRDLGGDLGWFARTGTLPDELAGPAFERATGELAGPVEGEFGVHLLQVTERQAGSLSLEDARERVLSAYGRELWEELVPRLRRQAKIRPEGFGRPVPAAGKPGKASPPVGNPPEGPPRPPRESGKPTRKPRGN